ncbi:MAG: DUF2752 domain-containing protein [Kiritimatiellae bacterium]|nr:DUF2752 domain-containing protein [Kiritimatiellia bacterium]
MVILIATVAGTVLYTLRRFNPETYGFYPRCIFFSLTGWRCPGCGFLRAMYSLLHGRIVDAFRFNPYLFIIIPVLIGMVFNHRLARSAIVGWCVIIGTIGWWIARNAIW